MHVVDCFSLLHTIVMDERYDHRSYEACFKGITRFQWNGVPNRWENTSHQVLRLNIGSKSKSFLEDHKVLLGV